MAQELNISEGLAGQSVTVTAFVAMFASLFITNLIGSTDRRRVVLLLPSCSRPPAWLVSFAGNFSLLLLGRLPRAGTGRLLGHVGLADHAPRSRAHGT